jgi:hypothetical protein
MIQITVDASEALTYLQRVSQQAPFAISLALNKVGAHAQENIRNHARRTFTLRRETFVLNTIKINREDRATKTRQSTIVRIDPERNFLAKFEDAGQKTARDGGNVAVPTEFVRRSKNDIIPKAQRPRSLLDSKAALGGRVVKTDKVIVQFSGRGRSAVTKVLYVLRRVVPIRPRLRFAVMAIEAVNRTWRDEMSAAFVQAEQTARR